MLSSDVLMVAEMQYYPDDVPDEEESARAYLLTADDFCARENEEYRRFFEKVLWQSFSTRGKFDRIYRKVDWVCIVLDESQKFIGAALVVVVGEKWLIEYVMIAPERRKTGVGTALMRGLLYEAKRKGAKWVILNCDPAKENSALLRFYTRCGFHLWERLHIAGEM